MSEWVQFVALEIFLTFIFFAFTLLSHYLFLFFELQFLFILWFWFITFLRTLFFTFTFISHEGIVFTTWMDAFIIAINSLVNLLLFLIQILKYTVLWIFKLRQQIKILVTVYFFNIRLSFETLFLALFFLIFEYGLTLILKRIASAYNIKSLIIRVATSTEHLNWIILLSFEYFQRVAALMFSIFIAQSWFVNIYFN